MWLRWGIWLIRSRGIRRGFFKSGCLAFTVEQVPEAMEVLEQRTRERGVEPGRVGVFPALRGVDIRPAEEFQRMNASLAVALAQTVLAKLGIVTECSQQSLPAEFAQGLEGAIWRGRCETAQWTATLASRRRAHGNQFGGSIFMVWEDITDKVRRCPCLVF